MGEFDQTVELAEATLQKLNIGPYSNNVYIFTCKETNECVIIDTSYAADPILAACQGAKPKYILQTHCHGDHIDAIDEVRKRTGVPLGLHPEGLERVWHQGRLRDQRRRHHLVWKNYP